MMQLSGRIACCAMSICFLTLTAGISAEVKLSTLLGDHMVLQRGKPVHVWGTADPAEKVTATFRGNATTTEADAFGRWSIYLPVSDAGGPFALIVEGKNTIAERRTGWRCVGSLGAVEYGISHEADCAVVQLHQEHAAGTGSGESSADTGASCGKNSFGLSENRRARCGMVGLHARQRFGLLRGGVFFRQGT